MKLKPGQIFVISVTEQDIKAACKAHKEGGDLGGICPIDQALVKRFPGSNPYTLLCYGKVGGLFFNLSERAREFVSVFDNKRSRKQAKPFKFRITLVKKIKPRYSNG